MNRIFVGALALVFGVLPVAAQSLDDLNIQIHGYATQGFLYSNANNYFTTSSTNGSPAWDEAVVNVSSQPTDRLRVGVQGRYFLLGNLGNAISLDWAAADFKVNDKFGVRFGKVKTPQGQFNEIQDIDPGYQWALLPQTVYPLESRNFQLSHYGGVLYGTIDPEAHVGKLEYRAFAGERVISGQDGLLLSVTESGVNFPNGESAASSGGNLKWKTPITGMILGGSYARTNAASAAITDAAYTGTFTTNAVNAVVGYGRYERNRFMFAAEYKRSPAIFYLNVNLPSGTHTTPIPQDPRAWYGMLTYKVTSKFAVGVYDTQLIDHQHALGSARYYKDWTINTHYDFNQYLYAKAEQHFVQGTNLNIDHALNLGGTTPNSRLTILKMGVSF